MSLAKKMYVSAGVSIPCVNKPKDLDLDDIESVAMKLDQASKSVATGKAPSLFIFVKDSSELKKLAGKLEDLWENKINFWLFYPKAPHLNTDLNRDKTWKIMLASGLKGTRQVGINDLWSCLYFKNS